MLLFIYIFGSVLSFILFNTLVYNKYKDATELPNVIIGFMLSLIMSWVGVLFILYCIIINKEYNEYICIFSKSSKITE